MAIANALRPEAAPRAQALAAAIGRLAERALRRELELTPKPGLVDRANAGAHHDMDYGSFERSLAAIAPWFAVFFDHGLRDSALPAPAMLPRLRGEGLACEQAMLKATGGVNTHKGSVFSFGLLCAAAGRLHGRSAVLARESLCAEVAAVCAGLVQRELARGGPPGTAGESQFQRHGLTGARGEAQGGYGTARRHGVTPYLRARAAGLGEAQSLHEALLHLMAHNADSNLVARGGLPALAFVQAQARQLLVGATPTAGRRLAQLAAFDEVLIHRQLSPGGSADLLAVSWFLAHLGTLATGTEG